MKPAKFPNITVFSLALLLGFALSAATPALTAEVKPEKWTADDVVMVESVNDFRISPDGNWVVWVKTTPDKEKDSRVSNLFLSSLVEKEEVQLTRGSYEHRSPRWSPDGQLIAFISDRPLPKENPKAAKMQLWLINPFGGEPWVVLELPRDVRDYEWIDNHTILFVAEEDPTLYEERIKEKKDTSRVVEDAPHTPPVRLFKLELEKKKVTHVSDNDDWIERMSLSPDGKKVVTVHERSLSYEFDEKVKPVTFLYDLETGTRKQLFTDGKIIPMNIRWTHDSQGFYAVSRYNTHPLYLTAAIELLYFYELARDRVAQVDLGGENSVGRFGFLGRFSYDVTRDGLIVLVEAGVRFKPARYTRRGETWERVWLEGEHRDNIFGWELSKDGQTLLYRYTTASVPAQYYRATLEGARILNPVQLTDLNPHFKKKPIPKMEIVHWRGALDEEVEGILYYPHNYKAGKKYPLVLIIHGGPQGTDLDAWTDSWVWPHNLLNQRGAFVLKANFHGSGNYGLKWLESLAGKAYDLEVPDLEKGVDYLIARGLVDPERLGTMGWSYGALLSFALTVENNRYKACSAGAGTVEWIGDWGLVDFSARYSNYYLGKSPFEDPELYIRKSPFFRMHKVRTPTIIFHGTEDRAAGPTQSWSHYRALQQLEQTDVRFVFFPGEPHGLRKLTHQRRKVEEEMAWFDRYLFQTAAPENEAFKKDSPLGMALKRAAAKKVGTRYGVLEKSVLIPEVVSHHGLELGRFEVTRAQYAAFDKNYRFEPGTENYPANNISFAQAQAYCKWLSQLTGQTYRLGNEEEMEPIYAAAKAGENTLDYWAGYSPNPDDAARLLKKVKELPTPAPLLKEVGSFKAVGEEEPVFDLGGSVAEWVIGKDGSGKTLGGSADRPQDAKAAPQPADSFYTGFRVVRGEPEKESSLSLPRWGFIQPASIARTSSWHQA